MTKAQTLKTLRSLHGWLGVILLPWIIAIGATGFYLNHARMILDVLEPAAFEESSLRKWAGAAPVDRAAAALIAARSWPDVPLPEAERVDYHGFAAYQFEHDAGSVIVAGDTGHYWVKTDFTRKTFAPDGTEVHSKIYWSTIFKRIHTRGWFDSTFASWLADITAVAMVLFGLTGLVLFWLPRARRFKQAIGKGS
ncbi:MAG: PepSY domain-containing protein [Yoonia sp.]